MALRNVNETQGSSKVVSFVFCFSCDILIILIQLKQDINPHVKIKNIPFEST